MADDGEDGLGKQTDANIKLIEEDAQKIRSSSTLEVENEYFDDVDDLSKYMDDSGDGVKILKDTTSINRKAVFHDLNRLKHWRESMDKASVKNNEKDNSNVQEKEHKMTLIMENQIDQILDSLPNVQPDVENKSVDNKLALDKLVEIERKVKRQFSIND